MTAVARGVWRRRLSLAFILGWIGMVLTMHRPDEAQAQPKPALAAPGALPGVPLGTDHAVGAGTVIDNLTVFPIYAKTPEDLGDFTTLEAAVERKTAIVRELGEAAAPVANGRHGHRGGGGGDGAQVNTLVIENKGKTAILVLAGTVVKGGKQDRQIGEDFIIPPGKTVNVDAFCVEHGRWDASREGKATGGTFVAQKSLALGSVRAAGQHDKNQGEVWNQVAQANAATKNEAPSGTLLATMDDKQIADQRARMATQLTSSMASAPQQDKLVGIAYAVDGRVKGVRWFAGPKLFKLHQDTLLQTAAMEAIAANASRPNKGGSAAPAKAESVASFVSDMEKQAVAEKRTKSDNVNTYKKSAEGYSSEVTMDQAPAAGAPPKPRSVSKDYIKK